MPKRKRLTIAEWPHKPFAEVSKDGPAIGFYYFCSVPKFGRCFGILTEANGVMWEIRVTPGGRVTVDKQS